MPRGYIRQRSKTRKDSWSIQVFLGVDPETKKRRYHNESVRGSRSDAERRLTELLGEMDGGSLVRTPDLTFGAFLEEWYQDYVSTSVRTRTAQGYRENMDRYVIPSLGGVPLDRLAPRHIQAMESSLLRGDGAGRRGLSAATVMQAHRVVSGALGHAVRMGILSRNPVLSVKPPRVPRYEARSLTWEEVGTLMEHIEDPGRRMLVLLALQTGLRRSELLGLQWRDLDLALSTLAVQRALIQMRTGRTELTVPKSGRSRVVALYSGTVEELRGYRAGLLPAPGAEDHVFLRPDGSPLDPALVTQWFKRTAVRAGFTDLRFHDLRHTHASLMLREGVNLKIMTERLGHSGVAITGDLYSHVQPTVQHQAVEVFGSAWRSLVGP